MKEIVTVGYTVLAGELIGIGLEVRPDRVYLSWNSSLRNPLLFSDVI